MKGRALALAFLFLPAQARPPIAALDLVKAATAQIGVTRLYESRYAVIAYPGGDVPQDRGVCSDVVVRAYRTCGIDLQQLVHEDMTVAWDAYPRAWGMTATDTNIDHRRVLNLKVFFRRHGTVLPITDSRKDYHPGDLVTWVLSRGRPHIGIVSARHSLWGTPLILNNIGKGTQLDDILFLFPITGHFTFMTKP